MDDLTQENEELKKRLMEMTAEAANNETIEIRQVMEMADFPADVKEAAAGFSEMQRGSATR